MVPVEDRVGGERSRVEGGEEVEHLAAHHQQGRHGARGELRLLRPDLAGGDALASTAETERAHPQDHFLKVEARRARGSCSAPRAPA